MHDYQDDLDAIAGIPAVQAILEVVCRTTGMGFSAIARVSDQHWICCAVKDDIAFGLKPGGELKVETTICNEIRQSGQEVVIDHVAEDPQLLSSPDTRDVRLSELHIGADRALERCLLRHPLRD